MISAKKNHGMPFKITRNILHILTLINLDQCSLLSIPVATNSLGQMNAKVNISYVHHNTIHYSEFISPCATSKINREKSVKHYPCPHTSSSSRKPSYQSTRSLGGCVYLWQDKKTDILTHWTTELFLNYKMYYITSHPAFTTCVQSVSGYELSRCTPYVHEAKSPDVGRVSVCYQAHHLLAGQLQCEQLVQQAEGRGHDASSANATDLQDRKECTKILLLE